MSPAALAGVQNALFSTFSEGLGAEQGQNARTLQKEEFVNSRLSFLQRFVPILKEQASAFPICENWLKSIVSIEARVKQGAEVFIGVIGSTGSGKSSLINALLDKTVVPANCMRACTSCVVEIRRNNSTNAEEKYSADIHYISPAEWALEFVTLKRDITNDLEGDDLGDDQAPEAKAAIDKLKAVYPAVPIKKLLVMTDEELRKVRGLSQILGKTAEIRERTAKAFSQAINGIIGGTDEGDQAAYWPLIRVVKVSLRAPILQNGLVLVDLPGQGDFNAARAHVADSYMRKLNHIWIGAKIQRAVDESVARNLLGSNFKRQLLMEDKYDDRFLSVIATHTDDIDYKNVIEQLRGKDKALAELVKKQQQLKATLEDTTKQRRTFQRTLNKMRAEIKSIDPKKKGRQEGFSQPLLRKRKRGDVDNSGKLLNESDPDNFPSRLEELKEQKNNLLKEHYVAKKKEEGLMKEEKVLRLQVIMECHAARNRFVQNRFQQDFVLGHAEYKEKISEVRTGQSANVVESKDTRRSSLATFCVSSTAYQSLEKKAERFHTFEAFPTLESTNIPQLQKFARECTLAQREKTADELINRLSLIYNAIKGDAESTNTSHGLSESQRIELLNTLRERFEQHEKSMQKTLGNTISQLQQYIGELKSALKKANLEAPKKAAQRCDRLMNEKIFPNTWKAICRRNGVFMASNQKQHNWHEDFAKVILLPLTDAWDEEINKKIPSLLAEHMKNVLENFGTFFHDIQAAVVPVCDPSYKPLLNLLHEVRLLADQAKIQLSNTPKEDIQRYAQDVPNAVKKLVADTLNPYTSRMSKENGKGLAQRMKKQLSDHIERNAEQMYAGASQKIQNTVQKMTNDLSRIFSEISRKAPYTLYKGVRTMLNGQDFEEKVIDQAGFLNLKKKLLIEVESIEKCLAEAAKDSGQYRAGDSSIQREALDDSDSDGDGGSDEDEDDIMTDEDEAEDDIEQKIQELDIIMQEVTKNQSTTS